MRCIDVEPSPLLWDFVTLLAPELLCWRLAARSLRFNFILLLSSTYTYPFFHQKTFLEFILDDGGVADLVELQLFEEDVIWNFDGSAQAAAALVVVEDCLEGQVDVTCTLTTDRQVMLPVLTARDCLEGRPMPVQVDLAASTIPIASSLGGIAE